MLSDILQKASTLFVISFLQPWSNEVALYLYWDCLYSFNSFNDGHIYHKLYMHLLWTTKLKENFMNLNIYIYKNLFKYLKISYFSNRYLRSWFKKIVWHFFMICALIFVMFIRSIVKVAWIMVYFDQYVI